MFDAIVVKVNIWVNALKCTALLSAISHSLNSLKITNNALAEFFKLLTLLCWHLEFIEINVVQMPTGFKRGTYTAPKVRKTGWQPNSNFCATARLSGTSFASASHTAQLPNKHIVVFCWCIFHINHFASNCCALVLGLGTSIFYSYVYGAYFEFIYQWSIYVFSNFFDPITLWDYNKR